MISDLLAIEGVRLPGSQRAAARASAERQGVEVPDELLEKIRVV
jgi:LDH2 family malate/lactate/ureidoglycolate dehydrogenase